jgi:pimeloyl-ACP methyl ester carboxylesterase
VRALVHLAPGAGLRMLLGDVTTLPVRHLLASLQAEDRARLVALFSRMRSGAGFLNDLRATPDVTVDVRQPTLVIASRKDGSVPFTRALSLAAAIRRAELVESQADSRFVWFGPDWPAIADRIRRFLTTEPTPTPDRLQ